MSDHEYLSAADTAKLIRAQLKKHFPACKFWVQSKTYAGGASIDIYYVDGPVKQDVERVVGPFNGAEFDGMVDLKSYNEAWLMPDGSAAFAEIAQDSQTTIHRTSPHPEARRVHFGADFIFVNRLFTAAKAKPIINAVCQKWGKPEPKYFEHHPFIGAKVREDITTLDWNCCDTNWGTDWEHIGRDVTEALAVDLSDKPAAVVVPVDPATVPQEEIEISWDRDWTWIRFPEKPGAAVIELLKREIGARYSGRRGAWYVMEQVSPDTIRLQLAAVGVSQAQP